LATTLLFLCAGATRFSRCGGFASPGEGLDESGAREATGIMIPERFTQDACMSPWESTAQTAQALNLPTTIEPALADIYPGRWSGLSFEEIEASDPDALSQWLRDPTAGAPEGETMAAARTRIGGWMDRLAGSSRNLCAISHPMMIRAALSHALGFPLPTTLSIDIAPLSLTRLSFNGKWRLQSLGLN
jgi:broad specificity phosphatase PhoE